MGASDVVPGVSGGTIAFISGIYEKLIESLNNINLGFFKTWKTEGFKNAWYKINGPFLLALLLGISTSVLSLAKFIKWLLNNQPILLWAFFFGLVLASILYVVKQIQQWNFKIILALLIATALSYFITILEPLSAGDNPLYLFFCGFIAIIAMILPGVSGAFILVVLGAYELAINTINYLLNGLVEGNFKLFKAGFINFIFLALGAITGLKAFSKALNWMFKYHKNLTLAFLTGFMIGSLNKIWPWKQVLKYKINAEGKQMPILEKSILPQNFDGDNQLLWALVFTFIGFIIIFILERIGQKKSQSHAE